MNASIAACRSLLRGLPLFFHVTPKTPLRVLGIIAFDMLRVRRTSKPLPRATIDALALFLDFQGCANAAWDRKTVCRAEYQALRQRLERAGLGAWTDDYCRRLRALESRRPPTSGDSGRFDDVRAYREAVARLSLATGAAMALDAGSIDEGIRATHRDPDVETLFRILMQCQIVDDVLDYPADLDARLPSFLTACAPLPRAMALTRAAVRSYAVSRQPKGGHAVFPLRLALRIFTLIAALIVGGARLRHGRHRTADTMLIEP